MSYRTGKLGTGLNFGGFGYSGKGDLLATRTTPYSALRQEGDNNNTGIGPTDNLLLDYDFTSKLNLNSSLRSMTLAITQKEQRIIIFLF
ncbi:MAG: hypothetical protein IPL69_20570 [Saprospiraceae bacterium]|nr:hypothetical protein [Candidatus Brachybacter algidus]